MKDQTKKRFSWFGVILLALFAITIFIGFGPPGLMEKTAKADFCKSCHLMQLEYDAWKRSSHQRVDCVECHLPNDNFFDHYLWKSLDGARDLFLFYTGRVSEEIHASERTKKTVQVNCIRCHGATLSRVNTDRTCWECHRSFIHKMRFAEEFFRENP